MTMGEPKLDDAPLSVSEVYEHAALIGKDIESMVNEYGEKSIEQITPKVVFILEQLELLTEKCTRDERMIKDLTLEKEGLVILTKRDEAIKRQLEEKLTYTEGLLSKNKKTLMEKIKTLRNENEALCEELERKNDELESMKESEPDSDEMEELTRTIYEQKEQIKNLNELIVENQKIVDNTPTNDYLKLFGLKLLGCIIAGVMLGCRLHSMVINGCEDPTLDL